MITWDVFFLLFLSIQSCQSLLKLVIYTCSKMFLSNLNQDIHKSELRNNTTRTTQISYISMPLSWLLRSWRFIFFLAIHDDTFIYLRSSLNVRYFICSWGGTSDPSFEARSNLHEKFDIKTISRTVQLYVLSIYTVIEFNFLFQGGSLAR